MEKELIISVDDLRMKRINSEDSTKRVSEPDEGFRM